MQGGVGRVCDAPPNATIRTPWPSSDSLIPHSLVCSCTLRARQPPPLIPICLSPFSSSLSVVPCAAHSLGVAAALSNSRCNIQRLLAVVCGGGSGHRHQKKSPTWSEPPTVKLAPLSINRCASAITLSLSLLLFSSCLLLSRNFLSLPHDSLPSLFASLMFLLFLSFCFLPLPRSCIGHRSLDVEALMRSSSRRWFIAN